LKKSNCEKKPIKLIKILKNRPVRFGFISLKPKKPNQTQIEKHQKKTEPNWKKTEPKLSQIKKIDLKKNLLSSQIFF
jgi:cytochrome oxidase Cu insertion factor (SCO1/SenC/PrrC family)